MATGIYIHIPFCISKCHYCSFFSVPFDNDSQQVCDYFNALVREIKLTASRNKGVKISSIYIGGGTPSVVSEEQISSVLETCLSSFVVAGDVECTIEANPATITPLKISAYRKAGVNRISIGAQSFSDNALTFLGRTHKAADIFSSVEICRQQGLENISVDLMFGYKGQTLAAWEHDIGKVRQLDVGHVSLYDLSVEEGSRFFQRKDRDELVLDDSVYLKMYDAVADSLARDYCHYEISNFAKTPEYISKHNMLYWGNSDYLGFGAGAFSYFGGKRWSDVRDIKAYCDKLEKEVMPVSDIETLSPAKRIKETFVLNLRRLQEGASLKYLENQSGVFFDMDFKKSLEQLLADKMLREADNSYFLTRKGIALFNQVAITLI